jgi:dihydrofolate reductase
MKTQYYTATSIDGFIADTDDSLEWLFEAHGGADTDARFGEFFGGVGAMAMGATTYRWVVEHEQLLEHPERWRSFYGDTPCWVFTHRELPPIPGANLSFVQGAVQPVHAQMRAAANERNIWIVGGGELVGRFVDAGLLDEIILGVTPVLLGAGAPLLPRTVLSSELTLTDVDRDGQFVFLTYEVARPA